MEKKNSRKKSPPQKDKTSAVDLDFNNNPIAFSDGITINYPEFDMKNEEVTKSKGGRPTKYKPEYAAQVEKLCLLGATDEDIAKFFQVAVSNINVWKKKNIEFRESIKRGKDQADANVATRLYQRALGYEHDEIDIRVVKGRIVKTPVRKIYPPDPLSIFYWLNNRQPQFWKQKQDITHKFGNGKIKITITKSSKQKPKE